MKKTKQIKTPDIYELLSAPTAKTAARKVIVSGDKTIHLFPDKDSIVPATIDIDMEFKNFDDFLARGKQTILHWHHTLFGVEADKKQDLMATALYVWAYFTKNGTPHLPDTNVVTGEKVRKSSIAGRMYTFGPTREVPEKLPPQAKTCYKIFTDCTGETNTVSEEFLKNEITRRAAELKTKQDPWRIFQYYRPQLIAAKLIKHD